MESKMTRLVVCWKDKPPLPERTNVYRVEGDVIFENGKAKFKIEQTGSVACVDVEQLERIFVVDTKYPAR